MAINAKKFKNEVKPLTIEIGGEVLNIAYRPHAYTPRLEEEAQRLREEKTASTALVAMLMPVLASWDLMDGEVDDPQSKPIPITQEALVEQPSVILGAVISAIGKDLNPQKASAPQSEGSFGG